MEAQADVVERDGARRQEHKFGNVEILSCDSVHEIWQCAIAIFRFYERFDTSEK